MARRDSPQAAAFGTPGAEVARVRPGRLAIAGLIMVASVVSGLLLWTAKGEVVDVWVANNDILPGTTIQLSDVRVRSVAADSVQGVDADYVVVGRKVRVEIPRGSPVSARHLFGINDTFAREGLVQVGVVLPAGKIPLNVAVKDILRLVIEDEAEVSSVRVIEVESRGSGSIALTLEVPDAEANRVARAAGDRRVVAVIVGRS